MSLVKIQLTDRKCSFCPCWGASDTPAESELIHSQLLASHCETGGRTLGSQLQQEEALALAPNDPSHTQWQHCISSEICRLFRASYSSLQQRLAKPAHGSDQGWPPRLMEPSCCLLALNEMCKNTGAIVSHTCLSVSRRAATSPPTGKPQRDFDLELGEGGFRPDQDQGCECSQDCRSSHPGSLVKDSSKYPGIFWTWNLQEPNNTLKRERLTAII